MLMSQKYKPTLDIVLLGSRGIEARWIEARGTEARGTEAVGD